MQSRPSRTLNAQLVNESKLPTYLRCNTCSGFLYDAHQSKHGCRMCSLCVRNLREMEGEVPVSCSGNTEFCKGMIISMKIQEFLVTPDLATRKDANEMKVNCPNSPECTQTMKLKVVQEHLDVCPEEQVECENCHEEMKRYKIDFHMSEECLERIQQCELCENCISFREMDLFHLDLRSEKCCTIFKDKCPYCSEGSFTREELVVHMETCTSHPRACKYTHLGCKVFDTDKLVAEHETAQESIQFHLLLLADSISSQAETMERLENNLSASAAAIPPPRNVHFLQDLLAVKTFLENECRETKEIVNSCKTSVEELYSKFKLLQSSSSVRFENLMKLESLGTAFGGMNEVSRVATTIQFKLNENEDRLKSIESKRQGTLEGQIHQLTEKLSQCETKLQTPRNACLNGILVWKLDNFWGMITETSESYIDSQPFYTSAHGYSMCARAYLDDATRINVALVTLKGQYDELLKWPFVCKTTFIVMDLTGHRDHKKSYLSPCVVHKHRESTRTHLLARTELTRTCKFISQDGSLYLKVIVDPEPSFHTI